MGVTSVFPLSTGDPAQVTSFWWQAHFSSSDLSLEPRVINFWFTFCCLFGDTVLGSPDLPQTHFVTEDDRELLLRLLSLPTVWCWDLGSCA